ncbi:MAG: hypothetical protein FWH50_01130, partial [Coriobacteriia bacterium]|nr:hypothetical protein [Coriobacteriia bacterium]
MKTQSLNKPKRRNSHKLKALIALVAAMMAVTAIAFASLSFADEDVTYSQAFPDDSFRAYTLGVIGDGRTDDDLITAEDQAVLAGITVLDVSNLGIADL